MAVHTVTHLNFHGRAREALEFYRSVFGGQLAVVAYGDAGMPRDLPGADHVLWGQVVSENGFRVMAYDVPASQAAVEPADAGRPASPGTRREHGMTLTREPFFVSVRGESVEEVGDLWGRLAEGASVIEAFGPSPWAPASGMLTDRFGVTWILDVAAPLAVDGARE